MPMDIIFQGMPMSLFQAKQQWSKMTNVVLMLCSSSLPPETPPLALGGPANQHSKTGHLWSKLTSARARQGVMANAGCVRTRPGVSIASVDAEGAILASGEKIPAAAVIWCAGMRADPLTARFPVGCDRLGRLPVDPYLKINGISALAPSRALASARMSVKRR